MHKWREIISCVDTMLRMIIFCELCLTKEMNVWTQLFTDIYVHMCLPELFSSVNFKVFMAIFDAFRKKNAILQVL